MNNAHYHLIVNHLPIVGLIIGTLVFVAGLLIKKSEVKLTGLGIYIFAAIASILAFYTGEGAEEIVENNLGISETLLHNHEEFAETFFTLTLILGAIAIIGFIALLIESRHFRYLQILILLLALTDGVLAYNVGVSGGEIRHSEIRSDANIIPIENDHDD